MYHSRCQRATDDDDPVSFTIISNTDCHIAQVAHAHQPVPSPRLSCPSEEKEHPPASYAQKVLYE
ncbi:hypothetical protein PAXRUDRAFT_825896 [Paxillus rubicundulus Ve08.2h10]|uniref:Uncharacterized protein n=1 Tax=Paxillus rubicundulus Ve08.2h10 TaxID=930991 RepID=A0A0D0E5A4_9AGAM|nr:hypothetical protein PAXRUDRAFT_825896 [Paxillus rubicundulus Ve08.2h10]